MNQSRLRFKRALKYCQQNENIMRATTLTESMMNNDMNVFWKDVHKLTNSRMPLATKVDGCVVKQCSKWKTQKAVMLDVNKPIKNSITITPFDILEALKYIKCGKSSCIDGISAEPFVSAHSHVLLSFLVVFFFSKKLPYAVTRDVCPSVRRL